MSIENTARYGTLVTASCLRSRWSWLYGQLWLFPDGLLRLPLPWWTGSIQMYALRTVTPGRLKTQAFHENVFLQLANNPKSIWLPRDQIIRASLSSDRWVERLQVELIDGSEVHLFWMRADALSALLERALSYWVDTKEEPKSGTLFTRKDFVWAIERVRDEILPLMVQEHAGSSEEIFWLFRGKKTDFRDAAHFWVTCLVHECRRSTADFSMIQRMIDVIKYDYFPRYEEISPEVFQATIDEFSDYLKGGNIPHEYHWPGQISTAMRISNEWNDVTVIGETEDEFVAFSWVTGA